MEEIPIICILIMLISFTECEITTIHVNEGDVAFLNFTYSCNSKEITLQRGNGAPFYNSRSETPPSSSTLKLRNETNGEICFLYLTINPVSRDNEGGYILTAYLDGPRLFEDDRILLLVAYPPGEASCVLSQEYIGEDWIRLHCTAPLGSIQGLITCYQDGIKIPPLNSPQQHDETLSQTLLARIGSLVYCCSSTLDGTKDRCDCKDSVWDPNQNKQVTNVMNPCPPTVPIPNPTFSLPPTENNDYVSSSPSTKTTMTIFQNSTSIKALLKLKLVVGILILAFIASIAGTVCYFKRHPTRSGSSNMESVVKKPAISEEEIIVLCEASTISAYYEKGTGIDGYDEEWRLIDTINVTDKISRPCILGCIDECNVIITELYAGNTHTYMIDITTKNTQRVITGSNTSWVMSCALLNDEKVVCGKRNSCTGDSLTGCIIVYDRQWKLINDVTIPRNTTRDATRVDVAVDQDGMIIAAEGRQSKIYVINPADGKIMNTITCKQKIMMRGVMSSGHIIAQPYPKDRRVLIIDREGAQREISHTDRLRDVYIDSMTDDIYVVTSDDEYKTCMIDQLMIGGDMKKRRVASFILSSRLMKKDKEKNSFITSRVVRTSSGNILTSNGDNILIFKN